MKKPTKIFFTVIIFTLFVIASVISLVLIKHNQVSQTVEDNTSADSKKINSRKNNSIAHYDMQWPRSFGGNDSKSYSSLTQITKNNVVNLELAWEFHSGVIVDKSSVQTAPILANNLIITSSPDGSVIGLEPDSGKEKWRTKLSAPVARRGLTFNDGKIYVPTSHGIHVLNVDDGSINKNIDNIGKFGSKLSYVAPIINGNNLFVANIYSIESYDLKTGKKLWETSLTKDNVEARVWSGFSYDSKSNRIFIVTSNSANGHGLIGSDTHDGGLSCSLIAIDGSTGRIIWQFQDTKHDIWDLDMVGPPLLTEVVVKGKIRFVVVGLSKTGNIIMVDRETGDSVFGYKFQDVPRGEYPNLDNALAQKKFFLPEPISSMFFDLKKDVTNLSDSQEKYVRFKIRNAVSGNYVASSLKNDVVMFGLHGGSEWFGGAVDDKGRLYTPTNKTPWILRTYFYLDKNEIDSDESIIHTNAYQTYLNKCAQCHKKDFSGSYQLEFDGDDYFPSLIGITRLRNKENLTSQKVFKDNHYYAKKNLNVNSEDLRVLYALFSDVDMKTSLNQRLRSHWQILLDSHGMQGSKPPWGYMVATDLQTGKRLWKVPFGVATDKVSQKHYSGDMNFGGVVVTKTGVLIANGTRDGFATFFNADTGEELHKIKLPFSGSSPPITYLYKGCQFVGFNATGGRFVGFGENGDSFLAYKLNSCLLKD